MPDATPAEIKTEERTTTWEGAVGLINASDYAYISKDSGCEARAINNNSCKNENWLYDSSNWQWTMNASSRASNSVIHTRADGDLYNYEANRTAAGLSTFALRPVIYLNPDVKIASGDGSQESPFIIK